MRFNKTTPAFMLLGLITAVSSLLSANAAQATESHAFCQAKLLKAATDGLVKEFENKARYVGDIRQITYNYGLEGQPRVIFIANHLFNEEETCIIDVRTQAPNENGDVCPDYKFTEVRTTCLPPSRGTK